MLWLLAVACNQAPLHYNGPTGGVPWTGPNEKVCQREHIATDEDYVIDGFTLCGVVNDKVPVDDPEFIACSEMGPFDAPDGLFTVYDGYRVRGYSVKHLRGRELIHDNWWGTPVLVDW